MFKNNKIEKKQQLMCKFLLKQPRKYMCDISANYNTVNKDKCPNVASSQNSPACD